MKLKDQYKVQIHLQLAKLEHIKNMYVHILYEALLTSQQDNLVFGAMNDVSEGIACVNSNLVDTLQVIILSSMIFD